MKKIIIVLLLLPMLMFGQEVNFTKDFDVKVGKPYKVVDARYKNYFYYGNSVISIKNDKKGIIIQKIDGSSMNEISRKEYDDFPKKMVPQFVTQTDNGLYYFYSLFDKKSKKVDYFVRSVNQEKGTFEKSRKLFSTSKKVLPSTSWLIYNALTANNSAYSFATSYDDSKYLIQYRVKPDVKRDKFSYDLLGFQVFDKDFKKLWGKEIKMPYTEKEMNNITYTIDSKGNVYMLAYLLKTKSYVLLEIKEDTKVIEPKPIDIDGNMMLTKISMLEQEDGNINCIGYYANGMEVQYNFFASALNFTMNFNGITQFTLDSKGSVVSSYQYEFPIDFINQYESKRNVDKNTKREEKGKLGIKDLQLRQIIEYDDGSTLIIGEQYFKKYEFDPLSRSGKTLYYYYEDIIAIKMDKNGKLVWQKKLPKEQAGKNYDWSWVNTGKGGMSYKYIRNEDSHYFIFLDNVKNINLPIDEKPEEHKDGKGGYLTAYKLDDKTGEVSKMSILNTKEFNGIRAYQFKTSRLLKGNDRDLYLEVYIKGKKDVMIKIKLK